MFIISSLIREIRQYFFDDQTWVENESIRAIRVDQIGFME